MFVDVLPTARFIQQIRFAENLAGPYHENKIVSQKLIHRNCVILLHRFLVLCVQQSDGFDVIGGSRQLREIRHGSQENAAYDYSRQGFPTAHVSLLPASLPDCTVPEMRLGDS